MEVSCDEIQGFGIVSCENVSVVLVVVDNSSDRSFEIDVDLSHLFLVADHDLSNDMRLQVISMEKSNVKFLLPESVFTSEIASLLELERFDRRIIIIFDDGFKDVNS